MAITQGFCTSFKTELLSGTHNFAAAGDTFKVALYTSTATIDATTTVYSTTNEVAGAGYVAGGATVAGQAVASSGVTAYVDFTDPSWAASTITARGALLYNSTDANKAVAAWDFGSDKTTSASTFSIILPAADSSNAIIRIT